MKLNDGKDELAKIPVLDSTNLAESFPAVMTAIKNGIDAEKKEQEDKKNAENAAEEEAEKRRKEEAAEEEAKRKAANDNAKKTSTINPTETTSTSEHNRTTPTEDKASAELIDNFMNNNIGVDRGKINAVFKNLMGEVAKIELPEATNKYTPTASEYKKAYVDFGNDFKNKYTEQTVKNFIDYIIEKYTEKIGVSAHAGYNQLRSTLNNVTNLIAEQRKDKEALNKKETDLIKELDEKKRDELDRNAESDTNSRENTELINRQQEALSSTSTVIPTSANNAKAKKQKKIDTINNFMADEENNKILKAVLSTAQFPVDKPEVRLQNIKDILGAKISDNINDEQLNWIYGRVSSIIKGNGIQKLSVNRKAEIKRNFLEQGFHPKKTGGKQITHNEMAKYKTHKKHQHHKRLQMLPQTLKLTRKHK